MTLFPTFALGANKVEMKMNEMMGHHVSRNTKQRTQVDYARIVKSNTKVYNLKKNLKESTQTLENKVRQIFT